MFTPIFAANSLTTCQTSFSVTLSPQTFAGATHPAEEATTGDSSSFHPFIEETSHPIGNGDGPNVTSLPTEVSDCPMTFTLLEVIDRKASDFVTPKSASQKDGK